MIDTRRYTAFPSNLDLQGIFSRITEYLRECKYEEDAFGCNHVMLILRQDGSRSITASSFPEFFKILAQYPHPEGVFLHTHWKTKNERIAFEMDVELSSISVTVESGDLNVISGIHEQVREAFHATVPVPERSLSPSRFRCKKTIFLAHRFDDHGKGASTILNIFLRRLGFDVREGEGYEAKDIPEKVAERIRSQDILICVVTSGDASWILSETAFAKGLGKYIIVLVEQGVDFNKGIVGADYEHLAFPTGFIEKAFNDLLYALPS